MKKKEIILRAEQSREVWIELLRVLCCFCVILLHVSSNGWQNAGVQSSEWPIYEFFHSITRIGVCCFVMISGALFLERSRGENIQMIYKKYILHILILIISWSGAYFVFRILSGNLNITGVKSVMSALLFGYNHLWYLWMILGLYAITPILSIIAKNQKMCAYFLILCVAACWLPGMMKIVPLFDKLAQNILQDKMMFFLPMGYSGYYVLGYYLYMHRITDKQKKRLTLAGIICMIYAVIGGILYSRRIGEPSQATYNNLTLNIACYSAMIFVLFKEKIGKIQFTRKQRNMICKLGKSTLGIYLVHEMFVGIISHPFMAATNWKYPFASLPVTALIFVLGYLVTRIVKRIPFVGEWIV